MAIAHVGTTTYDGGDSAGDTISLTPHASAAAGNLAVVYVGWSDDSPALTVDTIPSGWGTFNAYIEYYEPDEPGSASIPAGAVFYKELVAGDLSTEVDWVLSASDTGPIGCMMILSDAEVGTLTVVKDTDGASSSTTLTSPSITPDVDGAWVIHIAHHGTDGGLSLDGGSATLRATEENAVAGGHDKTAIGIATQHIASQTASGDQDWTADNSSQWGGCSFFVGPKASGAQTVDMGHVASTAAVYALTLAATASLTLGFLDSDAAVYGLTLNASNDIAPGFVDSDAAVYSLTVAPGSVSVVLGHLDSDAAVHSLTVAPGVDDVALEFLDSDAAVYGLTVDPGATPVTLGFLDSDAAVYSLTIDHSWSGPVEEACAYTETTGIASSLTMTAPSGIAAGERLLIIIGSDENNESGEVFNTPSGWDKEGESGDAIADTHIAAFSKVATGSESDVSITWSGGNESAGGWYCRYSSALGGVAVEAVAFDQSSSSSASHVVGGVTTLGDDRIVLGGLAGDGPDVYPFSLSAGWTKDDEQEAGSGANDWVGLVKFSKQQAAQGASGDATVTMSDTHGASWFMLALASVRQVALGFVDSDATVYSVTVTNTPVMALGFVDSDAAVYSLSIELQLQLLTIGFLDSDAAVYSLTVSLGEQPIVLGFLDSDAAVYSLTLTNLLQQLPLGLVDSAATPYPLRLVNRDQAATDYALLPGETEVNRPASPQSPRQRLIVNPVTRRWATGPGEEQQLAVQLDWLQRGLTETLPAEIQSYVETVANERLVLRVSAQGDLAFWEPGHATDGRDAIIRVSGSAALTVRSMTPGTDGQIVWFVNENAAHTVTFIHQDTVQARRGAIFLMDGDTDTDVEAGGGIGLVCVGRTWLPIDQTPGALGGDLEGTLDDADVVAVTTPDDTRRTFTDMSDGEWIRISGSTITGDTPAASEIVNDSTVTGTNVDDALENIEAQIDYTAGGDLSGTLGNADVIAVTSPDTTRRTIGDFTGGTERFLYADGSSIRDRVIQNNIVYNVSTVTGTYTKDALETLDTKIDNLDASDINNDSNVAGTDVDDALNNLRGRFNTYATDLPARSNLDSVNGTGATNHFHFSHAITVTGVSVGNDINISPDDDDWFPLTGPMYAIMSVHGYVSATNEVTLVGFGVGSTTNESTVPITITETVLAP